MIANHLMPRLIRFAIHSQNHCNSMGQLSIRLGNVDFFLERGVLVMSIPVNQWKRSSVEHDLMSKLREPNDQKRAGLYAGYRIRLGDSGWRCEGTENWAKRTCGNEIILFPEYCKTESQAWTFLTIERGLQPLSFEELVSKFVQEFHEEANQLARSNSPRYG